MNSEQYAHRADDYKTVLYKTALFYLGSESMAVDAVDEAVYQGFRKLRQLRQEPYLETWLMRILINICKKELRRQKRFVPDLPEGSAEDYDALPLREAIGKLPEDLRAVIVLRYFSGLTVAATAEALGIPQGTAATRIRRALGLLRLELEVE